MIGRARKSRFFLYMALVMATIVFVGFSRTFYFREITGVPDRLGSPDLPLHLTVHGIFLSAWYAIFGVQSWLGATRRITLHRRLGVVGAFVAIGVVIASAITVLRYIPRNFERGRPLEATANVVVGDFLFLLVFAVFVSLAVAYKHRPEIHKRLMLLGSVAIIFPAFRPPVPEILGVVLPSSVEAFSTWIVIALCLAAICGFDLHRDGRVSQVTLVGSLTIVVAWATYFMQQSSDFGPALVRLLAPGTY